MNPRLVRSPKAPATAPIEKEPAYQSGFSRLVCPPSSPSRCSHQARWSVSSAADSRIALLTIGFLAVSACPRSGKRLVFRSQRARVPAEFAEPLLAPGEVVGFLCGRLAHRLADNRIPRGQRLPLGPG